MKKVGIIVALREEVIALKRKLSINYDENYAQMIFSVGTIDEIEVVMVQAEAGLVNAALCTQILVTKYGVDYIVSTGLGAGLSPQVNIGDIILASDLVQQDKIEMEESKESVHKEHFYKMNKQLILKSEEILQKLTSKEKITIAQLASNDEYDSRSFIKEDVSTTFTAYCAEVESMAIAYACYMNSVPFIVIRCVSDVVNPEEEVNYGDFTHHAAKIMIKMFEQLIEVI